METVVVTAQKREEKLQDVPISIAVLGGEELDRSNVQGVAEALSRVPGVSTFPNPQGGGTILSVRGVAPAAPIFAGANPIAYYLDSLPFGLIQSAIAPDADAYDLERVEVLRGPQGTLYGTGGVGGVVRILTKDANLSEVEFKGRASGGETRYGGANYRADMALNVPLIEDKLAVRAVAGYQKLSGWIDTRAKEDSNDVENKNFRVKVSAQPTEALAITAFAWASRQDAGGVSTGDQNRFRGVLTDESIATDYDAFGLKASYDLPAFSVSSSSSYLDYASGGFLGSDAVPVDLLTDFDASVFSEEVNLTSSRGGPWRWNLGAMYRDAKDKTFNLVPQANNFTFHWSNTSKSYAIFGELGRRFASDQLEWTLGVRYFHDDVTTRQEPDATLGTCCYLQEAAFNATTPRAVLTWYPGEVLTVYGSYSEGFRSGTPQPYWSVGGVAGLAPLKPDNLRNYEVGAKGDLLSGRLTFDAAVYYLDWQDVQQSITVPFITGPVLGLVNVESASGPGFDINLTVRPSERLTLSVNMSRNDLRSDGIVYSGVPPVQLFKEGDRLNLSPELTYGASADYIFPMGGSGFEGRLAASFNYMAEQTTRALVAGAARSATGDAMQVGRASFSLRAPRHWELTLFADNISSEEGALYRNAFFNDSRAGRIRPRTIGVQFEYRL